MTTEYIINYIRRTFTQGNVIANALETREEVNMTDFMPVLQQSVEQDPTKAAIENKQYEILYRAEISKYVERSTLFEANEDKAFALLFAQCNKALQNKIMSHADFEVDIKGNPI
jgi:sulfatase maturation enzyme AslB (radical SAM superfamily)